MKLTRRQLRKMIKENVFKDFASSLISSDDSGELKAPMGESDLYSSPQLHMGLLVSLSRLPALLRGAKIPEMSESRPTIDEKDARMYIELANLLERLQ